MQGHIQCNLLVYHLQNTKSIKSQYKLDPQLDQFARHFWVLKFWLEFFGTAMY